MTTNAGQVTWASNSKQVIQGRELKFTQAQSQFGDEVETAKSGRVQRLQALAAERARVEAERLHAEYQVRLQREQLQQQQAQQAQQAAQYQAQQQAAARQQAVAAPAPTGRIAPTPAAVGATGAAVGGAGGGGFNLMNAIKSGLSKLF